MCSLPEYHQVNIDRLCCLYQAPLLLPKQFVIYFSIVIITYDYICCEPIQASLNKEEVIKQYSLFCCEACLFNEAQLQCNFSGRSLYNANFRVVLLTATWLRPTLWRYYAITPVVFFFVTRFSITWVLTRTHYSRTDCTTCLNLYIISAMYLWLHKITEQE